MKPVIGILLFIATFACLYCCEKKDEATPATVITDNVTVINPNSAIVTGKVLDNGGASTWEQGVMWTIKQPYPYDYTKKLGEAFKTMIEVQATGLRPNTKYWAKAYAVNRKGTAYGENLEFQTPGLEMGTFTDNRDGKIYKWVKLGNQTWMAENMAYMPSVYPSDIQGGIWVYDYNGYDVLEAQQTDEYKTYGCLYDWETACDICPDGWHLPSDDEWKELEMYLGMSREEVDSRGGFSRGGDVGNYLKEVGFNGCNWDTGKDVLGTDVTGFSARPAGYRSYHFYGEFYGEGSGVAFYTSTALTGYDKAEQRELICSRGGIRRSALDRFGGLSARCVKDE